MESLFIHNKYTFKKTETYDLLGEGGHCNIIFINLNTGHFLYFECLV